MCGKTNDAMYLVAAAAAQLPTVADQSFGGRAFKFGAEMHTKRAGRSRERETESRTKQRCAGIARNFARAATQSL